MPVGAPEGNQNAAKGTPWRHAIRRALENRSRIAQKEALDDLAEKLLAACDAGDLTALKELGDRLDGKANQSISGPDGGAIPVGIQVSYERPSEVP